MERPNNTFRCGEELEVTTSTCSILTNPGVHLESPLSLNLTLGFTNPTVQLFSCKYCWREFKSPQALGGHQNAHKQERTVAKKAEMEKMLLERYACMGSLPLHGSESRRLGIATHAPPDQGVQIMRGGARFEQIYPGKPIYMEEEDEAEGFWYGSFRHMDGVGSSSATPDLTLKL